MPFAALAVNGIYSALDPYVFTLLQLSYDAQVILSNIVRSMVTVEGGLKTMEEQMQATIDAAFPSNETTVVITKIQKSNTRRTETLYFIY